MAAFSPAFDSDRTMLLGGTEFLLLSTDGGVSFTEANLDPIVLHKDCASGPNKNGAVSRRCRIPVFQSLAFSPSFVEDQTAFACGYNIGVATSTDGGRTWRTLWRAFQLPLRGGSYVRLQPSPHYATDGSLATAAKLPGRARPRNGHGVSSVGTLLAVVNYPDLPGPPAANYNGESCTSPDTFAGGTDCYYSFDKYQGMGAKIYLSRDRGASWSMVQQPPPASDLIILRCDHLDRSRPNSAKTSSSRVLIGFRFEPQVCEGCGGG